MVSKIENDEVAYKEEFFEDQEELKRQMVESLSLQRSNSLSARFRRQRSKDIDAPNVIKDIDAQNVIKVICYDGHR